MKTKKRALSVVLVLCLAVSMIVAMSGCGKKSLEDYMSSSAMQSLIETQSAQYAEQGAELSMTAQGDNLMMDVTMTAVTATSNDQVAELRTALEGAMDAQASNFVNQANELKNACSNSVINLVITYYDANGTLLATATYSSTN